MLEPIDTPIILAIFNGYLEISQPVLVKVDIVVLQDCFKLPDEILYRFKGIIILHIVRADLARIVILRTVSSADQQAKGRNDLDGDSRLRFTSIVGIIPNLIHLLANFISNDLIQLGNTLLIVLQIVPVLAYLDLKSLSFRLILFQITFLN
ncbi:hypothetical protein G6F36_015554 [Rhizopus arrhizus]|nr:hypothetical protein G6F36_015554 [Rhizopus arrhizus]